MSDETELTLIDRLNRKHQQGLENRKARLCALSFPEAKPLSNAATNVFAALFNEHNNAEGTRNHLAGDMMDEALALVYQCYADDSPAEKLVRACEIYCDALKNTDERTSPESIADKATEIAEALERAARWVAKDPYAQIISTAIPEHHKHKPCRDRGVPEPKGELRNIVRTPGEFADDLAGYARQFQAIALKYRPGLKHKPKTGGPNFRG